jgi:IclR family transcriptional regulator, pca regulon regulatory protein
MTTDGDGALDSGGASSRRAGEGMAGLAKGLAILEAFGPGREKMTIAEAARAADLTRAAARRCLLTLVELGYLGREGVNFRPLPRLLRLGFSYLRSDPLSQLAQALLASVRDQAGESVSLAILEGGESVFVARSTVSRIVSTSVVVGARLPLYCSATGRVFLAAMSDGQIREALAGARLEARTAKTIVDPARLLAIASDARRTGFAASDEELEVGLRAIATPVCNPSGEVIAAMSVSTSAARMTIANMVDHFLPLLQRAAMKLGAAV